MRMRKGSASKPSPIQRLAKQVAAINQADTAPNPSANPLEANSRVVRPAPTPKIPDEYSL